MQRILLVYVLPLVGLLAAVQILFSGLLSQQAVKYGGSLAVAAFVVWMWVAHFTSQK
jgi:positive regulator of sigma E activity